MKLKQYRYGDGNLAYLVYSGNKAAAIDGGAILEISNFLDENSLDLQYVLNTHDHWDHTPGNRELLQNTKAEFVSTSELSAKKRLRLGKEQLEIFAAPGHTMDSIVFLHKDWLITGDTLFNGTVGNCYSEEWETYFNSLEKILSFPRETKIFAGHDLVDYALGVVEKLDPYNPYIEEYRMKYNPDFVVSNLEMELKINPFIRFNDPGLDNFRAKLNMPNSTPYDRWRAMMTVH